MHEARPDPNVAKQDLTPMSFEYNEVAVRVNECKENNRMGSTFYLCGGTASFICAR